jgi:hypothetical protein
VGVDDDTARNPNAVSWSRAMRVGLSGPTADDEGAQDDGARPCALERLGEPFRGRNHGVPRMQHANAADPEDRGQGGAVSVTGLGAWIWRVRVSHGVTRLLLHRMPGLDRPPVRSRFLLWSEAQRSGNELRATRPPSHKDTFVIGARRRQALYRRSLREHPSAPFPGQTAARACGPDRRQ